MYIARGHCFFVFLTLVILIENSKERNKKNFIKVSDQQTSVSGETYLQHSDFGLETIDLLQNMRINRSESNQILTIFFSAAQVIKEATKEMLRSRIHQYEMMYNCLQTQQYNVLLDKLLNKGCYVHVNETMGIKRTHINLDVSSKDSFVLNSKKKKMSTILKLFIRTRSILSWRTSSAAISFLNLFLTKSNLLRGHIPDYTKKKIFFLLCICACQIIYYLPCKPKLLHLGN